MSIYKLYAVAAAALIIAAIYFWTDREFLKAELEKTSALLAITKQSEKICEEKILSQNKIISAYKDDMTKRNAALSGKYKEIGRKYDALKKEAASLQTSCEEKLKAIEAAQKIFLSGGDHNDAE